MALLRGSRRQGKAAAGVFAQLARPASAEQLAPFTRAAEVLTFFVWFGSSCCSALVCAYREGQMEALKARRWRL